VDCLSSIVVKNQDAQMAEALEKWDRSTQSMLT
jgi:hypothetical protein